MNKYDNDDLKMDETELSTERQMQYTDQHNTAMITNC